MTKIKTVLVLYINMVNNWMFSYLSSVFHWVAHSLAIRSLRRYWPGTQCLEWVLLEWSGSLRGAASRPWSFHHWPSGNGYDNLWFCSGEPASGWWRSWCGSQRNVGQLGNPELKKEEEKKIISNKANVFWRVSFVLRYQCLFLDWYTTDVKPDQVRRTCFLGADDWWTLPLLVNTHHTHQILSVRQQICEQGRRHEYKCSCLCVLLCIHHFLLELTPQHDTVASCAGFCNIVFIINGVISEK